MRTARQCLPLLGAAMTSLFVIGLLIAFVPDIMSNIEDYRMPTHKVKDIHSEEIRLWTIFPGDEYCVANATANLPGSLHVVYPEYQRSRYFASGRTKLLMVAAIDHKQRRLMFYGIEPVADDVIVEGDPLGFPCGRHLTIKFSAERSRSFRNFLNIEALISLGNSNERTRRLPFGSQSM